LKDRLQGKDKEDKKKDASKYWIWDKEEKEEPKVEKEEDKNKKWDFN